MVTAEVQVKIGDESKREKLLIPQFASEVKLKNYVDFFVWLKNESPESFRDFLEAGSSTERASLVGKWTPKDWIDLHASQAKAISFFVGTGPVELMSIPLVSGASEDTQRAAASDISTIFNYVMTAITSHKTNPNRRYFEYQGDRYYYPQKVNTPWSSLTVGEAIEALQVENVYSQVDDDGKLLLDDAKYHIDIGIIAATCRKQIGSTRKSSGRRKKRRPVPVLESVPLQSHEWDAFYAERVKHLSDVTLDVASDAYFFLLREKNTFNLIPSSHTSSRGLRPSAAWLWLQGISLTRIPGGGMAP